MCMVCHGKVATRQSSGTYHHTVNRCNMCSWSQITIIAYEDTGEKLTPSKFRIGTKNSVPMNMNTMSYFYVLPAYYSDFRSNPHIGRTRFKLPPLILRIVHPPYEILQPAERSEQRRTTSNSRQTISHYLFRSHIHPFLLRTRYANKRPLRTYPTNHRNTRGKSHAVRNLNFLITNRLNVSV